MSVEIMVTRAEFTKFKKGKSGHKVSPKPIRSADLTKMSAKHPEWEIVKEKGTVIGVKAKARQSGEVFLRLEPSGTLSWRYASDGDMLDKVKEAADWLGAWAIDEEGGRLWEQDEEDEEEFEEDIAE